MTVKHGSEIDHGVMKKNINSHKEEPIRNGKEQLDEDREVWKGGKGCKQREKAER